MKIRKYEIIIWLLLLALLVRSDVHGRLTRNQSRNELERPYMENQEASVQPPVLESGKAMFSKPDPNVQKNLSEFGRKNPFMPLTVRRAPSKAANDALTTKATARVKPESSPITRLTAVFTATSVRGDKPTAIIEESGVSRSVSVGDTVAGMAVVEIRRGKVILQKGDKKCVVNLGVLLEDEL